MRLASHEFHLALVLMHILYVFAFIAWLSFGNYFATVFLGIGWRKKRACARTRAFARQSQHCNRAPSIRRCFCVGTHDHHRSIFRFQSFGFSYAFASIRALRQDPKTSKYKRIKWLRKRYRFGYFVTKANFLYSLETTEKYTLRLGRCARVCVPGLVHEPN